MAAMVARGAGLFFVWAWGLPLPSTSQTHMHPDASAALQHMGGDRTAGELLQHSPWRGAPFRVDNASEAGAGDGGSGAPHFTGEMDRDDTVTFSFQLKVTDARQIGADMPLLFWLDSWNIIGLRSTSSMGAPIVQLISSVDADDVTITWSHDADLEVGRLHHLQIDVSPMMGAATIWLDGAVLGKDSIPSHLLPFLQDPLGGDGVMDFDYVSDCTPFDGFELRLDDARVGSSSKEAGQEGGHEESPAPSSS